MQNGERPCCPRRAPAGRARARRPWRRARPSSASRRRAWPPLAPQQGGRAWAVPWRLRRRRFDPGAPFERRLAAVGERYPDRNLSVAAFRHVCAMSGAAAGSRTARIAASRFDFPASRLTDQRAQRRPAKTTTSRALRKPLTSTRVTPKPARARAGFTLGSASTLRLVTRARDGRRAPTSSPGARRARSRSRAPSGRAARGFRRRRGQPLGCGHESSTAGAPCSSSSGAIGPRRFPVELIFRRRHRANAAAEPLGERACDGERGGGFERPVHAYDDRLRPRLGVAGRPRDQHGAGRIAEHPARRRCRAGALRRAGARASPRRSASRRSLSACLSMTATGSPSRSLALAEGAIACASARAASASCCRSSAACVAAIPRAPPARGSRRQEENARRARPGGAALAGPRPGSRACRRRRRRCGRRPGCRWPVRPSPAYRADLGSIEMSCSTSVAGSVTLRIVAPSEGSTSQPSARWQRNSRVRQRRASTTRARTLRRPMRDCRLLIRQQSDNKWAKRIVCLPVVKRGRAGSEPACYRVRRRGAWRSLVSALVWGTRGPEFKSRRPDYEEVAGKTDVLA